MSFRMSNRHLLFLCHFLFIFHQTNVCFYVILCVFGQVIFEMFEVYDFQCSFDPLHYLWFWWLSICQKSCKSSSVNNNTITFIFCKKHIHKIWAMNIKKVYSNNNKVFILLHLRVLKKTNTLRLRPNWYLLYQFCYYS